MANYKVKKGDTLYGIAKLNIGGQSSGGKPSVGSSILDIANSVATHNNGISGIGRVTSSIADAAKNGANINSPSASAPAQPQAPTFEYKPPDAVTQADALLQQQLANKPGEWQGGTWTDNLNETISQILNMKDFSYNLNEDALYHQYADQYTTKGKLASMDVMGQAAAMTGGYGNSFAQAAGQQAYQGYLQQLNEIVPELYGMALDQHNQEVQNLYNQASLMAQMDEQEYGRYQDMVDQYYTDLNYLTENARYMSETEYQKALNDFNIKYDRYRDTVADEQWTKEFNAKNGGTGTPAAQAEGVGNIANADVNGNYGYYTPVEATETANTKAFRSAVMSQTEFSRHGNKATVDGKTYTDYNSYIRAVLEKWTNKGTPDGKTLSDGEVAYLISYYGM